MANLIRSLARRCKDAERRGEQVDFAHALIASGTPRHAADWLGPGQFEAHRNAWKGLTRRERSHRRKGRMDVA